jgi:hypothetical protein
MRRSQVFVSCLASVAFFALFALAACSASPPPPAETPKDPPTEPQGDAVKGDEPEVKPDAPKHAKPPTDAVPDDYSMTPHDCEELGKQYGEVSRHDLLAQLSPKLAQKQRDQASANIDKAVSKQEDSWIAGCQKNLVGNVVDQKSLKCAMTAQTVKAFDVCLNGEAPPPQPKK